MTAASLLSELQALGVRLFLDGDRLGYRAPKGTMTQDLLARVSARKAEMLALIAGPRSPAPAFVWDQAEAERLLAHLRWELSRLELTWPGGRFPRVEANVVLIAVKVCESYVRDHDLEAARGWDALALLRDAVPFVLELATPGIPKLRS